MKYKKKYFMRKIEEKSIKSRHEKKYFDVNYKKKLSKVLKFLCLDFFTQNLLDET